MLLPTADALDKRAAFVDDIVPPSAQFIRARLGASIGLSAKRTSA
jgi:hypothetical protein